MIEIVQQFASVSIQGVPRETLRRFGVPPGGAFDRRSLALANTLVGRSVDEPAYEVIGGSISIRCLADCSIGVAGACATKGRVPMNAGQEITLELDSIGCAYYLALGAHGPQVQLDQQLESSSALRVLRSESPVSLPDTLLVTNQISRAGLRTIANLPPHTIELPSEPACPGTLQVTPDGNVIILGPDGPTIGGYPKAGVVCSADLDKVGQLRPGETIALVEIDQEQAMHAIEERQSRVQRELNALRIAAQ